MKGFIVTIIPNDIIISKSTPQEINSSVELHPVLAISEELAIEQIIAKKPLFQILSVASLESLNSLRNLILNLAKSKNISIDE